MHTYLTLISLLTLFRFSKIALDPVSAFRYLSVGVRLFRRQLMIRGIVDQKWTSAGTIQLLAMPDAVRVLVVEEDCRSVVRADLVERVPSKVLIAHDLLAGELDKCLSHLVEIPLELRFRCFPSTIEQFLLFL